MFEEYLEYINYTVFDDIYQSIIILLFFIFILLAYVSYGKKYEKLIFLIPYGITVVIIGYLFYYEDMENFQKTKNSERTINELRIIHNQLFNNKEALRTYTSNTIISIPIQINSNRKYYNEININDIHYYLKKMDKEEINDLKRIYSSILKDKKPIKYKVDYLYLKIKEYIQKTIYIKMNKDFKEMKKSK